MKVALQIKTKKIIRQRFQSDQRYTQSKISKPLPRYFYFNNSYNSPSFSLVEKANWTLSSKKGNVSHI